MKDYIPEIRDYFTKLQDVLTKVDLGEIAAIARVLHEAYEQQRTILVMGNGGSGATASHMVCDLNKGACFHAEKKFRLISLCDCTPMILALGNDVGFESIFVEQMKPYARPGDVVLGISGSGNSPNVLRAIEYAKTARLRHHRRHRLRRRQAQAAGGPLVPRQRQRHADRRGRPHDPGPRADADFGQRESSTVAK